MRIYIGCALTHVPRKVFGEYATFIHNLAAALRSAPPMHEVKYALVNSDPQLAEKPFAQRASLCYHWDRQMVEEADVMIAEASFPSIGLGLELQIAEQSGKPIIVAFRDFGRNRASPVRYDNPDQTQHELQIGEGFVSLMALGVPGIVRVIHYTSAPEGIAQISEAVGIFNKG